MPARADAQVLATFMNPNDGSSPVVRGHLQTDDVGILWRQNEAPRNIANVIAQLTAPAHEAAIFADVLPPGTIFDANVSFGAELAGIFGDPLGNDPLAAARAPSVFIQPNWGVIYSGSGKKISEHGGGTLDDTHVALPVSQPGLRRRTDTRHVFSAQVAPTILRALGLDPEALEAVRKEHTRALPGLHF